MKPLAAAGWALAGALLASSAIYLIPVLGPGPAPASTDEEAEAVSPAGGVSLDGKAAAHAGLRIVELQAAVAASERTGFARALDLGPLAGINADIQGARAVFAASDAEARRQEALAAQDQSASVRAVELARAQARVDRARFVLAQRRIGLEYGSGLSRLESELDRLVSEAARGEAALVRLDFQDGAPPAGADVTISDGNIHATAHVLGPAVGADPNLQSAGVLAIVRGSAAHALAVGRVMTAALAGSGPVRTGVIVPREAIVRTQGAMWVYRLDPAGTFHRVKLQDAVARASGWFVTAGLRPGDRIAGAGATVLLGIEAGPPSEDE